MSLSSLFISHSSKDSAAAAAIGQRLRGEGYQDLFLDFDPEQGIPAGRTWERELYAQLRRVDGVIFLASIASVESKWCFAELTVARLLGKPIFPLRLESTVGLSSLNDVQWIDLNNQDDAFARLWEGLRRAGFDSRDAFAWDPTRSPYPGLQAFSPEDAAVFFGRTDKIDKLMDYLNPLTHGATPIVTVVGPSGSGKSSLVRAGLLPRLARLPDRWVVLPPMLPGSSPATNLARSFARALSTTEPPTTAEVHRRLANPTGLIELIAEVLDSRHGDPNLLVIIDQAEELITRTGEKEQHAFLGLIHEALEKETRLRVITTLRSEFLSRAPERAGLTEEAHAVVVEPLSRARLPEVIVKPAHRAGIDFEPGLVEQMVEDTVGGDALPLLAYTLQELYNRRDGMEGTITADDYRDSGGVSGALQRHADRIAAELARRGHGDLVLPTLIKLAAVSSTGEITRRRVLWQSLDANEAIVVQAFVDGWLLISESDAQREHTVEVAHEALLRQWPPLRDKIVERLHSLQARSELDRLAADWDRRGRGSKDETSYLVRGDRLDDLLRWADDNPTELDEVTRSFLRASEESVAAEAAAEAFDDADAIRSRQPTRMLRSVVVLTTNYKRLSRGHVWIDGSPGPPTEKRWVSDLGRVSRSVSWYMAFPFTLLNVAGFMEPKERTPRRLMRPAIGIASICLTLATAAWITVITETVWRGVYGKAGLLTDIVLQVGGPGLLIVFIIYRMATGRTLVDRPEVIMSIASIAALLAMAAYLHTTPASRGPVSSLSTDNAPDPMTPIVVCTTVIVALIALSFCIFAIRNRKGRAGFAGAALLLVLSVTLLHAAGAILRLLAGSLTVFLPTTRSLVVHSTALDEVAKNVLLPKPDDLTRSSDTVMRAHNTLLIDLVPVLWLAMVVIFGGIVWLQLMRERRRGIGTGPAESRTPRMQFNPENRAHFLVTHLPEFLAPGVIVGIVTTAVAWSALIFLFLQAGQVVYQYLPSALISAALVATLLIIIRRPEQFIDLIRSTVGFVADVAGFWAPDLHPLAGRSYRRALVSGIRRAVDDLADDDDSLALVGHSQGSVVCAWFVHGGHSTVQRTEGRTDRQVLSEGLHYVEQPEPNRIALFTCGSPLNSMYRTFFPRYFNDDFFETTRAMTEGRSHWRNYWRKTDPVAAPLSILSGDNVDVTELEVEETRRHNDYWRDPRLRADIIGFLATAQVKRRRAHWRETSSPVPAAH